MSLVIRLAGPIPYASDKFVPYQHNATMVENGQEIPLPVASSVVNIVDIAKVTHSGRVFEINQEDFYDEELPEESRNPNLALHISMKCKEDALSNMLVATGSSLNVLLKSTLSRLFYQGAPMRSSGVIVKAFDGSHKTVIGEVDLPVKIGPSDFHSTFQNGKLVVVGGEKALLVIHLSSFSYVEAEEEVGTLFQALSIAKWGHMIDFAENKNMVGLGFQQWSFNVKDEDVQPSFRNGGFIHGNEKQSAAVIEDDEDED
ncbi:hypothetical protein KIW84_022520 [Lathyrus oleraceus]|uniref:Uncharacterized protein n=1 Tax=Pisum sativum TaxID=3888 RepID=A0A9D5BB61_PEA|nr:hypothetical protein KIW84_022520 [Pisum sativum]